MAGSTELDLSLNYFKEPKTYTGVMGKAQDIKNLLFMKPGDFPSIPDMGINISSIRFEDIDALMAGDLREKIKSQITTYIANVPLDDVVISISKVKGMYVLFIDISLYADKQRVTANYAFAQKKYKIINFQLNLTENNVGRT